MNACWTLVMSVVRRVTSDLVEQVVAQVLGKAATRLAAGDARRRAEDERHDGEKDQQARGRQDLLHGGAHLDRVDEVCGHERDGHLACDLAQDQKRRGDGGGAVLSDAAHKAAHDGRVADLLARVPLGGGRNGRGCLVGKAVGRGLRLVDLGGVRVLLVCHWQSPLSC